jgi:hypothetical protein
VNTATTGDDVTATHQADDTTDAGSSRCVYFVAFRSVSTVQAERALGFTHSHNDDVSVLEQVDGLTAER